MIDPDKSPNFNADFFLNTVHRWPEKERLDFKQEYYNFSDEAQKFKFVKHVIAMANIARRTGEACWILFGVEDESKEILDIRDKYPGKNPPSGIKNPNNPKFNFHTMMTDDYDGEFRKCLEVWVSPDTPGYDFDYGLVEGKFVSYLTIKPKYTSEPFQLKKSYKQFAVGTAFVRSGASSVELPNSEKSLYFLKLMCNIFRKGIGKT